MSGRRLLFVIALIIPLFGWSQPNDRIMELLQSAPSQNPNLAAEKLNQFISRMETKRAKIKSDESFLGFAFQEMHRTFLNTYKAYSQFPEIFDSGNYDCLSATSLYSILLDTFGFEYKIIETNYHIFLIVETQQKQILIETTDRVNGFVTNNRYIKERLAVYNENRILMAASGDQNYYQYKLDLYQRVMPEQLTGLLYFNQAVTAFNNNDLWESATMLKKAIRIYNSPRVPEFVVILINKVAESELGVEEKKRLIIPFASFVKSNGALLASR